MTPITSTSTDPYASGAMTEVAFPVSPQLAESAGPQSESSGDRAQRQVSLFGIRLDALRMEEAVNQLLTWIDEPTYRAHFVVTPNVDHAVILRTNGLLQQAYRHASLVLADGFPIVVASWLLGKALPQRVAGSELVPELLGAARPESPMRVFLLGAAPGVAQQAANRIHARWPAVQVVGTYSPRFGFESDEAECAQMVARINRVRPDVLIVGLSAPKQELWVYGHRFMLQVKVALCVGATIDFLAGEKRQAPIWMRRTGLEWLHRMASEPRRLLRRYARDLWIFPQLLWREWRAAPASRRYN